MRANKQNPPANLFKYYLMTSLTGGIRLLSWQVTPQEAEEGCCYCHEIRLRDQNGSLCPATCPNWPHRKSSPSPLSRLNLNSFDTHLWIGVRASYEVCLRENEIKYFPTLFCCEWEYFGCNQISPFLGDVVESILLWGSRNTTMRHQHEICVSPRICCRCIAYLSHLAYM